MLMGPARLSICKNATQNHITFHGLYSLKHTVCSCYTHHVYENELLFLFHVNKQPSREFRKRLLPLTAPLLVETGHCIPFSSQ